MAEIAEITDSKQRLTDEQEKVLHHIISNGDDTALTGRQWSPVKVELFKLGLLRRRINDWAWVPTYAGFAYKG